MSRKRCRRKVWEVQAIPVAFSMRKTHLDQASLLARQCLDALLTSEATPEHVASINSVSRFCVAMVDRLVADKTIDASPAGEEARAVAVEGKAAIESVQRRLDETGKVGVSGPERQALVALMALSDEIDKVATRRQSRDIVETVFGDMFIPTSKPVQL